MRSYLSLIPISAKVHRRQNRMTLLCIIFAVFMVTAVFSMAEVGIRMEQARLTEKHGNFSLQDVLNSAMGVSLLGAAVVLFLLILIAGVLMISSSINSGVAQRTRFFGMMRCIGMSRQQVVRFVRLEALNWCKMAVPIGLAFGIAATWVLCVILRFGVGSEFSDISLFYISPFGIVSGILVGIITVLIAANSPARRASRVTPVTAVSGSLDNDKTIRHSAHTRFGRIEVALGMNHAVAARKNLILMTGSFALSIILFLSFSVMVDFINYLIPQSASTSDIDISSVDGTASISPELIETIRGMNGVKEVYGRRSAFDVSAVLNGDMVHYDTVDLVSYDDFDLKCLKKDGALKKGSDLSKIYGDSQYVLATSDLESIWKIGDRIQIGEESLIIGGLLVNDPFSSDGLTNGKITLITSGATFERLTGNTGYSLVMIQTTGGATDEDVQAIQKAAGKMYLFQDKRDQRTTGTYRAFVFCAYSFLSIIALVAVLNIVNSISMSVSARMRQYGVMRAVGMNERQVVRMVAFEALTYVFLGCVVGCTIGVLISRGLYHFLITEHFSYAVWHLPIRSLLIILLFFSFAACVAVYAPIKRICNMSITETINEL